MNKKFLGAGLVVVLGLIGVVGKNIYIANQIENNLQELTKKDNSINSLEGDVSCSGIFSTSCVIDDFQLSIINDLSRYKTNDIDLYADSIEIDNINSMKNLQEAFDGIKKEKNKRLKFEKFKEIITEMDEEYNVLIKNLKIAQNGKDPKILINNFASKLKNELQKNDEVEEFIDDIVDIYNEEGITIESEIDLDNGDIALSSYIEVAGLKLEYNVDAEIDNESIMSSNQYNFNKALLDTVINDLSIELEFTEKTFPEYLAFIINSEYINARGYNKRRILNKYKNIFGNDLNINSLDSEQISNLANSDAFQKNIEKFKRNLFRYTKKADDDSQEMIEKLLEQFLSKIVKLCKDDDNSIEIEVIGKKSLNEIVNNSMSIVSGSSKEKLSDLIELSIN